MPPFSPPLSSPPFFQRLDFERLRPLPPSSILLFFLLPLDLPPALQREMWRWIERREESRKRGILLPSERSLKPPLSKEKRRRLRLPRSSTSIPSHFHNEPCFLSPPLLLHSATPAFHVSFAETSLHPTLRLSLLHPFSPHTTSSSRSYAASVKPLPAGRNTNFPLPPLSRRGLWLDPRSRRGAPLIRPRMLKPLETDQRVGKHHFRNFFGRRLFSTVVSLEIFYLPLRPLRLSPTFSCPELQRSSKT